MNMKGRVICLSIIYLVCLLYIINEIIEATVTKSTTVHNDDIDPTTILDDSSYIPTQQTPQLSTSQNSINTDYVEAPSNDYNFTDIAPSEPRKKLKRILFWTSYFKNEEFLFGLGQEPFIEHKCRVDTCSTTNDKHELLDVDVLMFHGPARQDFPDVRLPHQLYVYVQKEPWLELSMQLMPLYKDHINLTMTYRSDSDVHLTYMHMEKDALNRGKVVHIDPKSKPKSIVWPVSHCITDSRREDYVEELKKYIDVDVYGDCGEFKCNKKRNKVCWELFKRDYRFMLSMENDVCKDYVTEKVYRPLSHNIVPIVYGGGDYSKQTPNNSVINILDYPNPKDLAKYLKYLTNNKTAYNEYFAWQSEGMKIINNKGVLMRDAFCELCALLHDETYTYKTYRDLTKWWVDGICDRDIMNKFKSTWWYIGYLKLLQDKTS